MRRLAVRRAALAARLVAAVALCVLLLPAHGRAAVFTGGYDGIGDAAGMALTLQQAGTRVVGRLTTPGGSTYTINGERAAVDTGEVQGVLRLSGATADAALFHVEERPLGLQLLFIPTRPDGTPDMAASREFSFLKRGVRPAVPAQPESRFAPAPGDGAVDLITFIDRFRRWDPRDTARLYAALDDRSRGLILLYDHATAELMWRLCQAAPVAGSPAAARLAEMMERQQSDCAAYLPLVGAAQQSSVFPEFLRRAQFQFEIVRATALCDRGHDRDRAGRRRDDRAGRGRKRDRGAGSIRNGTGRRSGRATRPAAVAARRRGADRFCARHFNPCRAAAPDAAAAAAARFLTPLRRPRPAGSRRSDPGRLADGWRRAARCRR